MAGAVNPCPGLIGQPRACSRLAALLESGSLPSLLFAGPAGVGKRTAALQLARAANCETGTGRPCGECHSCRTITSLHHPDVKVVFPVRLPKKRGDEETIESVVDKVLELSRNYTLDRAQPPAQPQLSISIKLVRWLRQEMARPPFTARRRFFIVLNAHQMTDEAANAFLKILEEPQAKTTVILTTNRLNSLLPTVRSRCRLVRFAGVPAPELVSWLVNDRGVPPDTARMSATVADGSPGRALGFIENPDDYLSAPALAFFASGGAGEAEVLAALDKLRGTPATVVVSTFLFLYHQALRARHGVDTDLAPAIAEPVRRAAGLPDDYLRRVIGYLAGRLREARSPIEPRLFLYTLLSSLRRPS